MAFTIGDEGFPAMGRKLRQANVVEWKKNSTEGDSCCFLDPSGNKLEIHVGDLDSRIQHGKAYWENKVQWYI
ncbi:MAG: hypothetical protein JNG85_16760 [Spirochaetaceae bacterium]|nr:hypothetical protein [Spirochaetaceae bacterium]